ncbi:MAG: AAA-like domain-containing protein [Deferribacterales bacterium]
MNENVRPGFHQEARREIEYSFDNDEQYIANYFSREWYVTNAGVSQVSPKSSYKYLLIKPTQNYEEAFSLAKEVIVIFTPYKQFEARSLDAYDKVQKLFQESRVEKICYVLVSKDNNIIHSLKNLSSNQEAQIIIPFYYYEFQENKSDNHFLRNRFRDFFYSRDLFDYSDPLKKDYYFFGRTDLVMEIIEKHKSQLNSGIFGLRKTGKTSLIYDVVRKLPQKDGIGIFIDCQDTSFNMKTWNHALCYVIQQVAKKINFNIEAIKESEFTETNASQIFEKYLIDFHKRIGKSILLLFDEIENITFDKSSSIHWCDGLDFIYFWQTIRSVFQRTDNVFSFCILGTNPRCVEIATIKGKDNPIFNIFRPKYIPGFDAKQTREMVRKLGKTMGMNFEDTIYSKLTEDYGGHPFLIRRIGSALAHKFKERPVIIDRLKYNQVKDEFNHETSYFDMLLEVLIQFYKYEYEMLELLANGDTETFEFYANEDKSYIAHLIGYGIIKCVDNKYDFKIDAIKEYMLKKSKRPFLKTKEEKWTYLCTERGNLEIRLRLMVKTVLKIRLGKIHTAKEHVQNKLNLKDNDCTYDELFDSRKTNIYFKGLKTLILSDWDAFTDYFKPQELFINAMDVINNQGRFDAHASIPTEEEIVLIQSALDKIKQGVNSLAQSLNMSS